MNESGPDASATYALPEHVRMNLKKHQRHASGMTCLECGYTGLVGVKSSWKPWYATWWGSTLLSAAAACVAFVLFGGIGVVAAFVVGALVSGVAMSGSHEIYSCPNCEADLQRR